MPRKVIVSPSQKTAIERLYLTDRLTTWTIGERVGLGREVVRRILRELKTPMRMSGREMTCAGLRWKALDVEVFDRPSPDRDYWVGFMMADGCVWPTAKSVVTQLILAPKDREHVYRFREFLGSTCTIKERPPSLNTPVRGKPVQSTGSVRLAIASRRLASSLAQFGVVPRKTYGTKVIGLEGSRDFWRGVVDGDGCLGIYKLDCRDMPKVTLIGSKDLMTQFSEFVAGQIPGLKPSVRSKDDCGILWQVAVNGRYARSLADILYSDCSVALPRKLAKAREIMAKFPV